MRFALRYFGRDRHKAYAFEGQGFFQGRINLGLFFWTQCLKPQWSTCAKGHSAQIAPFSDNELCLRNRLTLLLDPGP